ncbi:MAG TPA: metallophosphoesterase family protein [Chitinophagaceae bacterium]
MKRVINLLVTFVILQTVNAQLPRIPASYSNIHYSDSGRLYFQKGEERFYADTAKARFTLQQMHGSPEGGSDGITLNFGVIKGTLVYGLIPYGKAPHPLPVFRLSAPLQNGKVVINLKTNFRDPYDMVGWQQSGILHLGYRLMDERGMILYDGVVSVTGKGPFTIVPAIYDGPYVSNLTHNSAVVWFKTDQAVAAGVTVNGKKYGSPQAATHHEITVNDLKPGTKYEYTVEYGSLSQTYSFKTAPNPGSRKPFVFAYTSDSRHANGGGERMIYGANAYIMKKIAALAYQQNAVFMQFTGDMINGYLSNKDEQLLQLTNWKKAIEPFWHYMPVYAGQGNHEALNYIFRNTRNNTTFTIDKFPYNITSAEAVMREAFVNPVNGPESEDGSKYDPDASQEDFPSYKENVFYYTYDNVAMIVLNSDYWYAPSVSREPGTSGGMHGYLMDNQIAWLRQVIDKLEADKNIDHIFLTQHTPVFPNGGHVGDDMWYRGNNEKRPYVAGKPVDKGIIERRDEYLDILINRSKKVLAVLTGDEHNYNRLQLTKAVNIYPDNYPHKKLNVSRPIYQINNGAAGAPYYAQEKAPWSEHTKAFSVQNALCLFYVEGKKVTMKVVNPDTLNEIDKIQLR